MIWIIQAPDGKYYQVQADSAGQAVAKAKQLLTGAFGGTDLNSIIAVSPMDQGSPAQQAEWANAPALNAPVGQSGGVGGMSGGGTGTGSTGDGKDEDDNPLDNTGGTGDTGFFSLSEENPLAAYYRALQGKFGDITGPGLRNRQLRQNAGNVYSTFLGQEALGRNAPAGTQSDRFQSYASNAALSGAGYGPEAEAAFRDILAGSQNPDIGMNIAALRTPSDQGGRSMEEWARIGYDLASASRRNRFAGPFSNIGPSFNDLWASYNANTNGAPNPEDDWFDTLQRRRGAVRQPA